MILEKLKYRIKNIVDKHYDRHDNWDDYMNMVSRIIWDLYDLPYKGMHIDTTKIRFAIGDMFGKHTTIDMIVDAICDSIMFLPTY